MKKLTYLSFIIGAMFLASCASDNKDDPTSPSNPSSDTRDKFVAYWDVSENSAQVGGTTTHTVNITKSTTNSSEVLISNFSALSGSVRASVSNSIITIPYQIFGGTNFAQGSGTLTSSTNMNLTYTTTVSGNRDSCTAVYTKQ